MILKEKDFYVVNDTFDDDQFINDVQAVFSEQDAAVILDKNKGLGLNDWYLAKVEHINADYDNEDISQVQVNLYLEREYDDELLSMVLELRGVSSFGTTFDVMARPVLNDDTDEMEPNLYGFYEVDEWIAKKQDAMIDFKLISYGGLTITATIAAIGLSSIRTAG